MPRDKRNLVYEVKLSTQGYMFIALCCGMVLGAWLNTWWHVVLAVLFSIFFGAPILCRLYTGRVALDVFEAAEAEREHEVQQAALQATGVVTPFKRPE